MRDPIWAKLTKIALLGTFANYLIEDDVTLWSILSHKCDILSFVSWYNCMLYNVPWNKKHKIWKNDEKNKFFKKFFFNRIDKIVDLWIGTRSISLIKLHGRLNKKVNILFLGRTPSPNTII